MRPHPDCSDNKRCARHRVHIRQRMLRAEAEVAHLTRRLKILRAEIEAERAALNSYLTGPDHDYDMLLAAQTQIGGALRDMATQHQSCAQCGGFSREALDALLEPALIKRRMALGLPPPETLSKRAGHWPVRKGAGHFRETILRPYQPPKQDARHIPYKAG